MDFKGQEVQIKRISYMEKEKYYLKECRKKVAKNNVLHNIVPLHFLFMAPVRG